MNFVDPKGTIGNEISGVTVTASKCPEGWTCISNPSQPPVREMLRPPSSLANFRSPPEWSSDDDDEFEEERKIDMNVCRSLKGPAVRSACFQSANARDFARRNNRPLPPLITNLSVQHGPEGRLTTGGKFAIGGLVVGGAGVVCAIAEPCGAIVGAAVGVGALGALATAQ